MSQGLKGACIYLKKAMNEVFGDLRQKDGAEVDSV